MILISHRGNTSGSIPSYENEPNYIDLAIKKGFDVEVDIWCIDKTLWLGHDKPQYEINFIWICDRISKLWIHCKNTDAMIFFKESGYPLNYFWHQKDDMTITSIGYFWTYPGMKLTSNSIAVMPEIKDFDNIERAYGICSDFISKYTN
jgi:hypothetical protein